MSEKPVPRIEVDITIRGAVYWCPEDFLGSSMSWEEFWNRMQEHEYAKKEALSNILDGSVDDLIGYDGRHISAVHVRYVVKKNAKKH